MSGPLSVAFSLGGSAWASWLAYGCLWATVISVALRLHRLEEKQKPRLAMFFHPTYDGCIMQGQQGSSLFRIGVKTLGMTTVKNCQGHITKIEIDGISKLRGDVVLLTFQPGEAADSTNKTIPNNGAVRFLDVLEFSPNGINIRKHDGWPPHLPSFREIFPCPGNYVITIQVSGDETPMIEERFVLNLCNGTTLRDRFKQLSPNPDTGAPPQ